GVSPRVRTFNFSELPSPTPTPTLKRCAAGQVKTEISTDAPSYPRDRAVDVTMTITNVSDTPCLKGTNWLQFSVLDETGAIVWSTSTCNSSYGCPLAPDWDTAFEPGEKWSGTRRWAQNYCPKTQDCTGEPVPPGSYFAETGGWDGRPVVRAAFELQG
ncbi:MAG: hypothetical protein WDA27_14825, partial [Actinomycetota bacterium]